MIFVQRYAKKLAKALPILGVHGVEAVAKVLEKQANAADEPWKKTLLDFTADAIEKHGANGVRMAGKALEDLFSKRKILLSDITDDLETASDLLAALQFAEAQRKKAARDFLRGLGQTLGTLTKGFIKNL